jgi:lipoprotein-anchoring transpeptidase ErfK/SrfK
MVRAPTGTLAATTPTKIHLLAQTAHPTEMVIYIPQASAVPGRSCPIRAAMHGNHRGLTRERRLYYVLGGGQAIRYGVGVGTSWLHVGRHQDCHDEARVAGLATASPDACAAAPICRATWQAGPITPSAPGRCIWAGSLYRSTGSNEPHTIGQAVSSGCIRMTNDDVVDLYTRVGSAPG